MSRGKRNSNWLQRQRKDQYVQSAKQAGLRSRAAFKLAQMDDRDRFLGPGRVVIDLGAAPGGWSKVAAARVAPKGRVLAVDLLAMDPIPGVEFLCGDFLEPDTVEKLRQTLGNARADVVMSDMAPNISGIRVTDQARALELALSALAFAEAVLEPQGIFMVKGFQGSEFEELVAALKQKFRRVQFRKPGASRNESREIYLLASGYSV